MVTFLLSDHTHVNVNQMFSNLVIHMLIISVSFPMDLIVALSKSNLNTETQPTGAFLSMYSIEKDSSHYLLKICKY
jgi:hypothetical protein